MAAQRHQTQEALFCRLKYVAAGPIRLLVVNMKKTPDIEQSASQFKKQMLSTSKANWPGPLQLSVYDGSRQFIDGYVWATLGDKRVQVIAPGPISLTSATTAAPVVIWALPPNPDEPNGMYLMVGNAIDGATNNRIPSLTGTSISITGGGAGTGTVTSVALSAPSILSVSGSPITTSGTIALALATQSANTIFAGPTSGGAATPAFRSLVAGDIPQLAHNSLSGLTTGDDHTQYLLRQPSADWTIDASALRMGAVGGAAVAAQKLTIYTGADANKGLQIRQNSATQSGNLLDFTNSSGGTILTSFNSSGQLGIGVTATIPIMVYSTITSGAGEIDNSEFRVIAAQTVNQNYAPVAFVARAINTGTANITNNLTAGLLVVNQQGSGTITLVRGGSYQVNSTAAGAGNITTVIVLDINAPSWLGASSVTTWSGARISNQGNAKFTTSIALNILDQSGSASNYAIQTNAGNVYFNNGGDASSDLRWSGDTLANLLFGDASADSIGINTATPSALTYLDVVGTTKSTRPAPGMTTAQRDALATPPDGALVYNTDSHRLTGYYNDGWVEFDDILGWISL